MAKKIPKTTKAIISCLGISLVTGSVLSMHYLNDQNFIPPDITPSLVAFAPVISSANASGLPVNGLLDPNPLIGKNFKANTNAPGLSNINPGNIPTPPPIPKAPPSLPGIPGILNSNQQGTYVTGIILPNVAILSISGKSHVVKIGTKSPLGTVENIDSTGATIDGKHYAYERT